MTVTMLVVGRLIGRISYRLLLCTGWVLMAAGLEGAAGIGIRTGEIISHRVDDLLGNLRTGGTVKKRSRTPIDL